MAIKIMFVCMGNICRSPVAHAVFEDIVQKNNDSSNFYVDSSGTGAWHVGEPSDHRMRETAKKYGIDITHLAQQLTPKHLNSFDLIFAMDQSNKRHIHSLDVQKSNEKKIHLFRDFDPSVKEPCDVPDPYYGGIQGFEEVFEMVQRTNQVIYDQIKSGELPKGY